MQNHYKWDSYKRRLIKEYSLENSNATDGDINIGSDNIFQNTKPLVKF